MKRYSLLLVVALTVAAPGWSQTEAAAPAPAAPAPAAAPALNEKKDLISVDFPNEEIRTILRNVADLFELNLVVPDTLQGRTSIKLRNVTWRQIFNEVLAPQKYTYVEDQNIIRVVSMDALTQQPTKPEVFILNYARANEILPVVSRMVDTSDLVKGSIQVDQRNNALVIRERPSQLEQIRPIIEKLDVATAQVMIETKFIEVTNDDSKNIGINWTNLSGLKVGLSGESTVDFGEDAPSGRKGLMIPTKTGNILNSLFNEQGVVNATFSASEFSLVLSLLKSEQNVRLVSNPTVVTLNNVEANIAIGQEFPIPNYTYNQERGSFEISGFNYKPIGIILKVTPQVNNAGFIKLNLEPQVSSIAREVTFGGTSTATIPVINTRNTKTQVSLKNGYTMGIGGLIENTTSRSGSKVPILGDIPVIGHAFRSKGNKIQTRNLVIFITAKTLDSGEPKVEEIFNARELQGLGLKPEDMPGYRPNEPIFK